VWVCVCVHACMAKAADQQGALEICDTRKRGKEHMHSALVVAVASCIFSQYK